MGLEVGSHYVCGVRSVAWIPMLAMVLAPTTAQASVCCGDPAGLGERLGRFESAATSIAQDFRLRVGGYDADGRFTGMPEGASEVGLRLRAAWTVRLFERVELGTSLPLVATFASRGGTSDDGGGVGDAIVGARFTLVPLPLYEVWPGIQATVATVVPLGRPTWRSDGPLGSDVTGQGVPELRFGLTVEEVIDGSWFVLANGSVGVFAESAAGGREVQRAPRLGAQLVTGPIFEGLALGVGVEHEQEASPSIEGIDTTGGRRQTLALVTAMIDLADRVSLVPNVRAALPVTELGRAEKADVNVGVALRMGWVGR
jgi:hypothetical protein